VTRIDENVGSRSRGRFGDFQHSSLSDDDDDATPQTAFVRLVRADGGPERTTGDDAGGEEENRGGG